MGVTNALYNYGFKYTNLDKPYDLEGFVNSKGAIEGLEFYKSLYDCCVPPGSSDWYMSQNIDAYKSGQVALQMNFAFIWPGVHADPNVGGDKSGISRTQPDRAVILLSSAAREFPLFPTPTARTQRLSTSSGSHKDRSKRNGGNWAATPRLRLWSRTRALPPASPMLRPSWTPWLS